jgi:hypothetical protein
MKQSVWLATVGLLSAGFVGMVGASASAAPPATGTFFTFVSGNSGKCLDAASASTANGTAVQQYTCNGSTAQQWELLPGADAGYYVIVNANAPSPAIDVDGPSTATGAKIHLWSNGGWSSQEWQPVQESSGAYHFVSHYSGLCLDVPSASTADGVQLQQYTCNGTGAQSWTLNPVGGTTTPPPTNPNNPDLGPNVKIFTPSMSQSSIQSTISSVYNSQQSNQFGTNRYALLFTPGSYNVDVPVGFYTQVAGLGASPDDVSLTGAGIHVDAAWSGGNATQNFWRSVENLSDTPSSGTLEYAVSQADPFRRVDVHGNMTLDDYTSGNNSSNWSSGGYIGDSRISGQINSGTQQQFLFQDTQMGSFTGSNWNLVFAGDTGGVPGTSFPSRTNVGASPVNREKPYLYVDSTGLYNVMVPALRTNASGPSWTGGSTAGTSIPIDQFYVVKAGDTASTINAALAAGKNLLVTPGVYHLNAPISITRANTVVLGLGLATFVPDNGVTAITTADVDGIDVAGLLISAGTTNSPTLMQVGPAGSSASHASNPIALQDVFFRVGGDVAGKATQSLVVNSANTIGSDNWIWRADHGSGVGWNTNTAANGLVVNGNNVTMYGLAVEHYQQYQTLWNGNGGRTYFYQSEMPYDVPNNASWSAGGGELGYPSYKVANSVTSHQAWGTGVYCYFSTNSGVVADRGIEVPASGTTFHDMIDVSLGGTGTINHIINNSGAKVSSASNVQSLTVGP